MMIWRVSVLVVLAALLVPGCEPPMVDSAGRAEPALDYVPPVGGSARHVRLEISRAERQRVYRGPWTIVGADEGGLLLELHDNQIERLRAQGLRLQVVDPDPVATTHLLRAQAGYHDYESLVEELQDLATAHPAILRLELAGESVSGRAIWAARVTDNPDTEELDEPVVRVTGLHHGNELTSGEIALGIVRTLVEGYDDPYLRAIVDGVDLWVYPVVNPDGYVAGRRTNANGVDLNRNYGFQWNGASIDAAPFSEPETRAMAAALMARPAVMQFDFHTTERVVNTLWDYTPALPPDADVITRLSEAYSAVTGYRVTGGWDWYEAHGSAQDGEFGLFGTIGWTIETPLPGDNPERVVEANVEALIEMLAMAGEGLHGRVTSLADGAAREARVRVLGRRVDTWSSADNGAFHRLLPGGRYHLEIVAPGFVPTVLPGLVVPEEGRLDGVEVALREGGGHWAHRLLAVEDPDPNNTYERPGLAADVLGPPDGRFYAVGPAALVLDMGRGVPNTAGDDLVVYVAGEGDDDYTVQVSTGPWGPWTEIGRAAGSATFDLAPSGLRSARYFRIEDDGDDPLDDPLSGVRVDAVGAWRETGEIDLVAAALVELTGDGDGVPEAGERAALVLTVRNLGLVEAREISARVEALQPALGPESAPPTLAALGAGEHADLPFVEFTLGTDLAPRELLSFRVTLVVQGADQREEIVEIALEDNPGPGPDVVQPDAGTDAGTDAGAPSDAFQDAAPDLAPDMAPGADTAPGMDTAPGADTAPDFGLPPASAGSGGCAAGGEAAPWPLLLLAILLIGFWRSGTRSAGGPAFRSCRIARPTGTAGILPAPTGRLPQRASDRRSRMSLGS